MSDLPRLGVLGGMGPLATLDFLHKLLEATPAARDQDHIPTLVWNDPSVPDRQAFMAGRGPSPVPAMLSGIAALNAAGVAAIVIPCNTAHIWLAELQAASAAPILSLIAAAAESLAPGETVGLVATRATLESGLYQKALAERAIAWLAPEDEALETLFRPACYAVKGGDLTAGGQLFSELARHLFARGADKLILGCSEAAPALAEIGTLRGDTMIDPVQALARVVLRQWGRDTR